MRMQKTIRIDVDNTMLCRWRDLRECFAACVYSRGLSKVAAVVEVPPSNLSLMLSGERNLDPEIVEKYMVGFSDPTPAQFWAARFLQDRAAVREQAINELPNLVRRFSELADFLEGSKE